VIQTTSPVYQFLAEIQYSVEVFFSSDRSRSMRTSSKLCLKKIQIFSKKNSNKTFIKKEKEKALPAKWAANGPGP